MNKWNIPNDWTEDDGYVLMLACVPNSRDWKATASGALYELTRGRRYDETTGTIIDAQAIGREIFRSIMTCDLDDLTTQVTRIADALHTDPGGPSQTSVAQYLQHLQVLGAIPGSGDSIQATLWRIADSMGPNITLDDAILDITAWASAEVGPDSQIKDFLETLTFIKALLPNLGIAPLSSIMQLLSGIFTARYRHNDLSLKALQAQHLRYLGQAIAAAKPGDGQAVEDEEGAVKELWDDLISMPWLTQAVVAIFDPSPAGEITLVARLGTAASNWFATVTSWWSDWWNTYINQAEPPALANSTVTGELALLRERLDNLPDPVDYTALLAALGVNLEELDLATTVNNYVTQECGCCGGAGGGAGGGGFYDGPGTAGDPPPLDPPDDPATDPPPNDWPDWNGFYEYKCKAANSIVLNLAELAAQVGEDSNIDISQFGVYSQVTDYLYNKYLATTDALYSVMYTGQLSWVQALAEWEADLVAQFLWADFGPPLAELVIFDEVRLAILADRQRFVCPLFASGSVAEAHTDIMTEINGVIAGTAHTQDAKDVCTNVFEGWLNNQLLNRLFSLNTNYDGYVDATAVDCDACTVPTWWEYLFGTKISHTNEEVVIDSIPVAAGNHLISFGTFTPTELTPVVTGWVHPVGGVTNFSTAIDYDDQMGASGAGAPWDFKSDALFTDPTVCRTYLFMSGAAFSVTYTRTV